MKKYCMYSTKYTNNKEYDNTLTLFTSLGND